MVGYTLEDLLGQKDSPSVRVTAVTEAAVEIGEGEEDVLLFF